MLSFTLSITEAALYLGVTKQAIITAIKSKRIEAHKKNHRWAIHVDELEAYLNRKYDRTFSRDDEGNLIFNPSEGKYSVSQLCEKFDCPHQRIYYLLRTNQLKYKRLGYTYLVEIEDEDFTRKVIEYGLVVAQNPQ